MNNITLSNTAIDRIKEITAKEDNKGKFLRISVTGGGCSGFQYIFELDDNQNNEDILIAKEDSKILAVSDETSLEFLKGAEIEFISELGASYFKVNNPKAVDSCGCGSSFSI